MKNRTELRMKKDSDFRLENENELNKKKKAGSLNSTLCLDFNIWCNCVV